MSNYKNQCPLKRSRDLGGALKVINFKVHKNFLYDSKFNEISDLIGKYLYCSPNLSLNYFKKLNNTNLINKNN